MLKYVKHEETMISSSAVITSCY